MTAGKIPAIAALAYHRASGRVYTPPNQRLGYAENFLYMLDANLQSSLPTKSQAGPARSTFLFILHAEHENETALLLLPGILPLPAWMSTLPSQVCH